MSHYTFFYSTSSRGHIVVASGCFIGQLVGTAVKGEALVAINRK
jgi:hypothetical protein